MKQVTVLLEELALYGGRSHADQAVLAKTIENMSAAFAACRRTLRLEASSDKMTELVAHHIIELAQRRIRDRTVLYVAALEEFTSDSQ